MPADMELVADPRFILLAWAAGLALATAWVLWTGLVGKAYLWMATAITSIVGLAGVFTSEAWFARFGFVLLIASVVLFRRSREIAAVVHGLSGALLLAEASSMAGPLLALSGALALGGVTAEMVLGHWYLVDPRLPRLALRRLAYVGIAGLVLDAGLIAGLNGGGSGGAQVAFWALTVVSIVLMAGVLGALRYPAYSGVMAATGLSYLAVLTTLGMIFLGRSLAAGVGPFVNGGL